MSLLKKILNKGSHAVIVGIKVPEGTAYYKFACALKMEGEQKAPFVPHYAKDFFRDIVKTFYVHYKGVPPQVPIVKEACRCYFAESEMEHAANELWIPFSTGSGGVIIDKSVLKIKEKGFDIVWALFCYEEGNEDSLLQAIQDVESLEVDPSNETGWEFMSPALARK